MEESMEEESMEERGRGVNLGRTKVKK